MVHNVKARGSGTVHNGGDIPCRARKTINPARLVDTDELVNCPWCLGSNSPKALRSKPATAPDPFEVVQALQLGALKLGQPIGPDLHAAQQALTPPPPKYSELLKRQALGLLETAILMERDGL
jgi:hypothetical protein